MVCHLHQIPGLPPTTLRRHPPPATLQSLNGAHPTGTIGGADRPTAQRATGGGLAMRSPGSTPPAATPASHPAHAPAPAPVFRPLSRPAFSLPELLVVVGVIAIVVSLVA